MVAEQNNEITPEDLEVIKVVTGKGQEIVEQLWEVYPPLVLSMTEDEKEEFLKMPSFPLTNQQLMLILAYTVGLEKGVKV